MTRSAIAVAGVLAVGLVIGPATAQAHDGSTCGVNSYAHATTPTPANKDVTVTYGGDGFCSSPHWLMISTHDGWYNDTGHGGTALSISIRRSFTSSVCQDLLNAGKTYSYTASARLSVANPGGGWTGHPIDWYQGSPATATWTCPPLLPLP